MHNGRDVSKQGHCVSGTIHFKDEISENSHGDTSFRTSHHPTLEVDIFHNSLRKRAKIAQKGISLVWKLGYLVESALISPQLDDEDWV